MRGAYATKQSPYVEEGDHIASLVKEKNPGIRLVNGIVKSKSQRPEWGINPHRMEEECGFQDNGPLDLLSGIFDKPEKQSQPVAFGTFVHTKVRKYVLLFSRESHFTKRLDM